MTPISREHPWTSFDADEGDWADWHWQLKNAVRTQSAVEKFIRLTESEREGIRLSENSLPFQVTPHFLSLIDPIDPTCPLRRQVIPTSSEAVLHEGEFKDPLGEDVHSPTDGLVHKYATHVLFLVTDTCASYCRHCTRRRIAGGSKGAVEPHEVRPISCATPDSASLNQAVDYIRRHSEIRDVLISGGDPLLLSDDKLERVLSELRAIDHVQILRIGTRVPAFLPMRVTEKLAATLRRFAPLYVVTHFNHSRELTPCSVQALGLLADRGIVLENQTVLLRGINSETAVLKELFEKLLMARVRPYYLHQLDLAQGIEHFRTPLDKGVQILRELRGHTSGLAIPHLAVDLPLGYGKVTLGPDFVERRDDRGTFFQNWEGKTCPMPYPEAPETDCTCPYEHRSDES